MNTLVLIIKDYFSNSTFHGLRFIAEEKRHWTERLFWLLCCLLSWIGSAVLIASSWYSFQNNAISFVVETTYLDVDTKFPSVSVCEEDHMARIYAHTIDLYGPDHDCNLDEVIKEIAFFRGTSYYIKEFCFTGEITCPDGHYLDITNLIRSPCVDIFEKCKWKDVEFDCCQHFKPIHTELGVCYTLSSKTEKKGSPSALNLDSNTKLGLGLLYIEVKVSTKVFMHAESDMPFQNTITTVTLQPVQGVYKHVGIYITDIENEPEVRQLSVYQRKCRFPEENPLTVSSQYSNSACVTECRKNAQIAMCNCTSHLMPNADESMHCDIQGILCLNNHYYDLAVQKTKWGHKPGLNCDCLPGCEESEYNSVVETLAQVESNNSILEIALDRLPTERYKRNVVRGRMDLVVSMGGATGLFVGASLLSFAEFIYYFTLRLYNNFTRNNDAEEDLTTSQTLLVAPLHPLVQISTARTNTEPVYPFYM